jgi:hypothetical protein
MGIRKCLAWLSFVVGAIFLITGSGIAQNAVPMLINYQGMLRDPVTGEPVPDGEYDMVFRIYDIEFGGTYLWKGSHDSINGNPIAVQDGLFTVLLGSGTGPPLSASLFNGADRWLEIVLEGETLEPRQRLASVPYSFVSENSRLLDGQEASNFASASHLHSGDDIVDGIVSEKWIDAAITRDSELSAHAADNAAHHKKTTSFAELTDTAADAQIPAGIARDAEVMPTVLASDGAGSGLDADRLDGLDSSDFLSSSNDYGRSGVASNLYEGAETLTSKYVNATGPESVTGSSTDAMFHVENSGTGYAFSAYAASSYGIRARSDGDTGYGVYGLCHGKQGYGVVGSSGGEIGGGVWGDAGGESGRGVSGNASGEKGRGVEGIATNSGVRTNYGGWFEANAEQGHGTHSIAWGVEGIGVYAKGKYAGVYSDGDVEVDGDIEVTGDLLVGGAYRGSIGPNKGAPFPRPAYDSGWQSIKQGETITLTHNIGGNPDSYVVDLQFMSLGGNVHHEGYGGKVEGGQVYPITLWMGAWWQRLTEESIQVQRYKDDDVCPGVRVRIWVYQ